MRENKIVLNGRGMPERQERRGISCVGGDNPEENEVPGKERVLLWIYFRSGEVSLGRSLNNVLYLLGTVKVSCSLRGDLEPEELPKICGEEEGGHKETSGGLLAGLGKMNLHSLFVY